MPWRIWNSRLSQTTVHKWEELRLFDLPRPHRFLTWSPPLHREKGNVGRISCQEFFIHAVYAAKEIIKYDGLSGLNPPKTCIHLLLNLTGIIWVHWEKSTWILHPSKLHFLHRQQNHCCFSCRPDYWLVKLLPADFLSCRWNSWLYHTATLNAMHNLFHKALWFGVATLQNLFIFIWQGKLYFTFYFVFCYPNLQFSGLLNCHKYMCYNPCRKCTVEIYRKIISEYRIDYLKTTIFPFLSRIAISINSMIAFEQASTGNHTVYNPWN